MVLIINFYTFAVLQATLSNFQIFVTFLQKRTRIFFKFELIFLNFPIFSTVLRKQRDFFHWTCYDFFNFELHFSCPYRCFHHHHGIYLSISTLWLSYRLLFQTFKFSSRVCRKKCVFSSNLSLFSKCSKFFNCFEKITRYFQWKFYIDFP